MMNSEELSRCIGRVIEIRRKSAGITRRELSQMLKLTVFTIKSYETGKTQIRLVDFLQFCELIREKPEKLIRQAKKFGGYTDGEYVIRKICRDDDEKDQVFYLKTAQDAGGSLVMKWTTEAAKAQRYRREDPARAIAEYVGGTLIEECEMED